MIDVSVFYFSYTGLNTLFVYNYSTGGFLRTFIDTS